MRGSRQRTGSGMAAWSMLHAYAPEGVEHVVGEPGGALDGIVEVVRCVFVQLRSFDSRSLWGSTCKLGRWFRKVLVGYLRP